MPAPSNTAATTAIDIGTLPYSTTQDVHDAGTTYTVWYKYTAEDGVDNVGLWGFGGLGSYEPECRVYLGPDSAPVLYLGGFFAINVPLICPVEPGTTYYFQFITPAGNPSPASLAITAEAGPTTTETVGKILITNFAFDGDATLVDPATGDVVGFRRMPPSDDGEMLPSGIFALQNGDTDDLDVWGADFVLIDSVALGLSGTFNGVTSDRAHTFFAAHATNLVAATVTAVSDAGVAGDTWTLPADSKSLICMGVTRDQSILYYAAAGDTPVRRYDLVNDVPLSDLVAGRSGISTKKDMPVLPNGDVFVGYGDNTIYRYDSTGATVQTYSTAVSLDRFFLDVFDQHLWIWTQTTPTGTFTKVRIADGVVVEGPVTTALFGEGVSRATAAVSMEMFGVSNSCPMLVTPGIIPPPEPVDPVYIRRERQFLLPSSDDNKQMFCNVLELLPQPGVGLISGQGEDPQVMLSISRDGGQTWGTERWVSAGEQGQYKKRVRWLRNGRYRNGVAKIVVSDPVDWQFVKMMGTFREGSS